MSWLVLRNPRRMSDEQLSEAWEYVCQRRAFWHFLPIFRWPQSERLFYELVRDECLRRGQQLRLF